ncbi:transcription antitermination factor NusB [Aeromicrobium sp.]|uniref:transcription antitermination factor NusB n=1 Tax=Aeromicrobium sp. TaxID=1871063 RepID=UPI0019ACBEBE|nr:transcription antitermination factor NusB [Aeromicrobium sp.]MBC7633180.1 transcription antitermination factor NusB [Aeromicrobium sp.]
MSARTKSRKRALDILFESELQSLPPGGTLADRIGDAEYPVNEYAVSLVEGVVGHRDRLDEIITENAVDWTLERMPAVDRNLLRIGAYEILYVDDVPDAVAVSEAVGLARELSTDESPSFVNGLLSRIVELKPTLSS